MKFYCDLGVLPLEKVNFSVQVQNSIVSDSFFTMFTLPFEIYGLDREIIQSFGDYISYESADLQRTIKGLLTFENNVHEAELVILEVQGTKIMAQLDFGFEDVPNFEKKLSELPLENFKVNDIHVYARTIATKVYPEVNFNFPRIFTKKYPTTDDLWKNFDGYLNDLKKDGTEMRRNYIDTNGDIYNVNIIHPCPHLIYLVKVGFQDAGYILQGDILTDPNLLQKWIYSGTEYFSRLTQNRQGMHIQMSDYDTRHFGLVTFEKPLTIEKKGKYKIIGYLRTSSRVKGSSVASIDLNGTRIFNVSKNENKENFAYFDIELNTNQDNSIVTFKLMDSYDFEYTDPVIEVDLINTELSNEEQYEGEDKGVITNLNEIDLRRAVPDITFGQLVRILKNWFNYDVDIRGKTVYMNLVKNTLNNKVNDFTFMEIPRDYVKRKLLNKRSFLLKFPELDEGEKKDNMYYDVDGSILNGKEKPETNIIDIDGYLMPLRLPKPGGYSTASVLKDSSDLLSLVEYTGLQGRQNNASYSPGCDFPELFTNNWYNHLRQRVGGWEYVWSKKVSIEEICKYSIKDKIFCYHNIHIITSMNKDKISENYYNVEMTTETIV